MKNLIAVIMGCGLGMAVSARTVALWPLEASPEGTFDGRSQCDPADEMKISGTPDWNSQTGAGGLGWNLPPNPDGGRHLFEQGNYRYARGTDIYYGPKTAGAPFTSALVTTNSFTLEGWAYFNALPAEGSWSIIAYANSGASSGGFNWSLRNRQGKDKDSLHFELFVNGAGEGTIGRPLTAEEEAAFCDRWHHLALVYVADNGQGKFSGEMFLDGVSLGSPRQGTALNLTADPSGAFSLGGRPSGPYNKGAFDYWRLSDRALLPTEFLSAGSSGQIVPAARKVRTVAYWPLRRNAQGVLDCLDYAGGHHLDNGFRENVNKVYGMLVVRGESAFKGQPPNATSSTIPTSILPNGNQDCLGAFRYPSFVRMDHLCESERACGSNLTFTIEVYYCPVEREMIYRPADDQVATFLTSIPEGSVKGGWALQCVRGVNGRNTWRFVFSDDATDVDDVETYVAYGDFTEGGFVAGDGIWRHIALTFNHQSATWELFQDGVSLGTVVHKRDPGPITGTNDYGYLGGNGTLPGQVCGYFDCFRYCQNAALTPKQFLCETADPKAVSGVIKSFQPWDFCDSTAFYGACVNGASFFNVQPATYATNKKYVPALSDDTGPTVANPDQCMASATEVNAAQFRVNGKDSNGRLLRTRDDAVCQYFGSGKDMTLECYLRPAYFSSDWMLFFNAPNRTGGNNFMVSLRDHADSGFCLWDSPSNHGADYYPDKSNTGLLTAGNWFHFALVRKDNALNVYTNGVLWGSLSKGKSVDVGCSYLEIGGRGEHTWQGDISDVRLSDGALEPADFLCSSVPTPPSGAGVTEPDGTLAYWKLDNDVGAARLDNAVLKVDAFAAVGEVTGVDDQATSTIKNPDASVYFEGNPKTNSGAVALDAGAELDASYLGQKLETVSRFTVEGWINRAPGTISGEEIVCGTWTGATGWYLALVPKAGGQMAFAVKAVTSRGCLVDAVFPELAYLATWQGEWTHIALVYDAAAGAKGTWTLMVNGQPSGTIPNRVKPVEGRYDASVFRLGNVTDGFVGKFDVWRVTKGVLDAEGLLYRPRRGLMLIFR